MLLRDLYDLIHSLPVLDGDTPRRQLPANGLYLFFERGETSEAMGYSHDRIVRVGINTAPGRFPNRIRSHYGLVNSLGGNKNGSVFRKHLGGALLRSRNENDPRLQNWLTQGGQSYPEVEAEVSQRLRDRFTFVCVQIDDKSERLLLEQGLIALLAQSPSEEPSPQWLGQHAVNEKIGRSGLWNTQHVGDEPLTSEQFDILHKRIEETAELMAG